MIDYTRKPNPGCLLIVDDQEANIQIIGAILSKLGCDILPACAGSQTLKRLGVHQPDLILLNLLMPETDGFELCRKIKENPKWAEIPIIFLSAVDDTDMIVRAFETGGVDFITKPFNQAELITRVRSQLALKRTRDALKKSDADRDEMLGMLTHDLKNHLGGIHLSAGLLRDRAAVIDDTKLRLMADNISASSGQMLSFVKEFLANASADHELGIKTEDVDLLSVISRALRQYDEQAKRKDLNFTTTLPASDALVKADPAALNRVVDNLLSNAVKFSPPGKDILITVRPSFAHVECEVQDQGPGFKPEDHPGMFGRYSRLSARPTGGEPSTGLGLNIVKKMVHAMRGRLDCLSSPGGGATFIFSLPRVEAGSRLSTRVHVDGGS